MSLPVCFIHPVFAFWVTHRVPGWDHPVNRQEEEFSYPSSQAGLNAPALSGWAVPDPHGVAHTSAEQGLELGFSKPRVWTIEPFSTCAISLINDLITIQPLIGKTVFSRAVLLPVATWKQSMPSLGALLGAERVAGCYAGAPCGEMTLGCAIWWDVSWLNHGEGSVTMNIPT